VTRHALAAVLAAALLSLGAAPPQRAAAPAKPSPARPAAAKTGLPDGWPLVIAGKDAAAEEAFAKRLAADPRQLESAIGLAALLEGRGDPGGAMAVLERALARSPTAPLAPGAFARLMGLGSRAPDGGASAIPLLSAVVSGETAVAEPEIRSLAVLSLADVLARGGELVPAQELLQGYGGRLARWALIGPYGKFERLDLYRDFPPDAGEIDPKDDPPGVDGRPPIRVEASFPDGRVLIPESFGEDGVVFAVSDVVVDKPATLRLRVLAPGSLAVLVDGRQALVADRVRERQPIALAARVAFPPGRHRITVKVALDSSASFALSLEPLDAAAVRTARAAWREVPVEGQPAGGVRIDPLAVAPDALPADLSTRPPAELLADAWWMRARRLERSAGALLESASARYPEARLFTVLLADHLRGAETGADPAKDLARSRALLEKAVQGDGARWIAARVSLARHDEDANRLPEAWQASEAILADAPGDPEALFLQYRIAARRNWRAEADDRIERARSAAPGRNDLLDAAIEWYRRSGAASRLAPAAEERNRRDASDEEWAELLAASGQTEAARAAWERTLAARPTSTGAWLGLARLEADSGRTDAALATIDRGIAVLPREAALYEERAALLAQLGNEAEATAALAALLDLQPGRLEVREALRQRGVADPLSPWLVDAKEVIRTARKPGPGVDAALLGDLATVLIDREAGQTELYQGIHGVYTRAGVEREGELEVLPNSWIQGLRLHKPDARVVDVDPGTKRPISLPGLEAGDFIEYSWRRYTPPSGLVPGSLDNRAVFVFQGQDRDFVLSRYVVMHDPALPVQICGYEEGLTKTDEIRDGLRVRTWTAREVPQLRPEPHTADPSAVIPNVKLGLNASWADIGDLVKSAIAGSMLPDAPLPEMAAEIRRRAGGKDPEALARALHAVVTERIRPGGSPLGLGTAASMSASAGEGNRVTVALALAQMVGLEARLLLARPLELRGTAMECPSPDLFPYALVEIPLPDRTVYLDYTDADYPFDSLPLRLTGSDGLSIPLDPEAPARLVEIARRDPGLLQESDAELVLEADGRVTGNLTLTLRGVLSGIVRRVMSEIPPDRKDTAYRSFVGNYFAGAQVISAKVDGLDQPDGDVTLSFAFTGGAFGRRLPAGFAVPVTAQKLDLLSEYASLPSRQYPLLLDAQEFRRDRVRVRIPDGLRVAALPPPAERDSAYGRYGLAATVDGDRLALERTVAIPPRRIEVTEYPDLRRFLQEIDDAERAEVELIAPTPALAK
jgi:tetratricopeptide (TPR) repeat protein